MVDGNFTCSSNKLKTLKHAPTMVVGYFAAAYNEIESIEYLPRDINRYVNLHGNKITSLEGIHNIVKRVDGDIIITDNPIKSHVLGVILIKGCTEVVIDNDVVGAILNKYLGKGRQGVLDAQEELIEAGLEEYAQL